MAASLQLRPQNRDLGMVMQEVDENLAIFLGAEAKSNRIDDFLNQELSIFRVHEDCLVPSPTEEEKEDSVEKNTESSSSSSQLETVAPPMSEESVTSTTANGKSAVAAALSSSTPGKPKSKSTKTSDPHSTNSSRSKSQSGSRPVGRSKPGSPSLDQTPSVRKPASKNPVLSRPSKNSSKPDTVVASSKSRGRPPRQQQTTTTRISDDDDALNPVLVGTKMVERVVNMRKLAPPDSSLLLNPKKAGFGRSLSKKSLEMAIRHMDITRSITEDLRRKRNTATPGTGSIYSFNTESPPPSDCGSSSKSSSGC